MYYCYHCSSRRRDFLTLLTHSLTRSLFSRQVLSHVTWNNLHPGTLLSKQSTKRGENLIDIRCSMYVCVPYRRSSQAFNTGEVSPVPNFPPGCRAKNGKLSSRYFVMCLYLSPEGRKEALFPALAGLPHPSIRSNWTPRRGCLMNNGSVWSMVTCLRTKRG